MDSTIATNGDETTERQLLKALKKGSTFPASAFSQTPPISDQDAKKFTVKQKLFKWKLN
jgi:hypothetical protein